MATGATRRRNVRTAEFRALYARLPESIRRLGVDRFRHFRANPGHPSLRLPELADDRRGRHRTGSRSVAITMQYRAIYVVEGDVNVWYWVGTHGDNDDFTGRER